MQIRVAVTGIRPLTAKFKGLEAAAHDWTPALERVADDFLDVERARFRTGAGWAPLTRRYRATKRRQGYSTKKLVRTGALLESLTNPTHPNHVRNVESHRVEVGTSLYYAPFHTRKRPPVKITPAVRRRWRTIFEDHIRS